MTDKKILFLVIGLLSAFFVLFHMLRPSKQPKPALMKANPALEVEQLKETVESFGKFNTSLHRAFKEEKEKTNQAVEKMVQLQEELKETVTQKELLSQELTEARSKLEVTLPLRQRALAIEEQLVNVDPASENQSLLKAQVDALLKGLDTLSQQIPVLAQENRSYRTQVETLSTLLQGKDKELVMLKQQTEEDKVKNKALNQNVDTVLEQLMSITKEKAALEQKLADLQKNTGGSIAQESAIKETLLSMEKNLQEFQGKQARLIQEKQELSEQVAKQKTGLSLLDKKNHSLVNEVNELRASLEKVRTHYEALKDAQGKSDGDKKAKEDELARRRTEISDIQEKLTKSEAGVLDLQFKYKEAKKESALLREQFVYLQLEREKLRDELNQAKVKLYELQSKFQQIEQAVKTGAPVVLTQPSENTSKKVNVELEASDAKKDPLDVR
jgi:chromosome segregation ATPase